MAKKVKTTTVTDVINVTRDIGDQLTNKWNETKDLKVIALGLDAYKTSVNAAKAQLIYKKLTGDPESIAFLQG